MYLTTEGYGGSNTIYRATLDHLDRQIPLSAFRNRLASIKITPNRQSVADAMIAGLKARGFEVITATAPWKRGLSHYSEYLKDMIRVSQHEMVHSTPLIMACDHDYVLQCHQEDIEKVLYRMVSTIESDPNVLSFRFLREEDKDALAPDRTELIEADKNMAWSQHINFQPKILRSRDYYHVCKIIEDNWGMAQNMHGEALWREVMAPMSRSPKKHAVWLPDYACVGNLGVPNYQEVAKRFNLTIAPNIE